MAEPSELKNIPSNTSEQANIENYTFWGIKSIIGEKMSPKCVFDHMWFRCDLDL